jgi:hypothetical protein
VTGLCAQNVPLRKYQDNLRRSAENKVVVECWACYLPISKTGKAPSPSVGSILYRLRPLWLTWRKLEKTSGSGWSSSGCSATIYCKFHSNCMYSIVPMRSLRLGVRSIEPMTYKVWSCDCLRKFSTPSSQTLFTVIISAEKRQCTDSQKPNSWTNNFVEVSGHNLESSQNLNEFLKP